MFESNLHKESADGRKSADAADAYDNDSDST